MKRLILIAATALSLNACAPLLGALMTGGGTPPQAPAIVTTISRTAIDFALNSFDAALYGLDFAMDAGKLTPGSDKAKRIAAAGRTVMKFLGVADAARDLGSSATYEEAFSKAKTALDEFRSLFPTPSSSLKRPSMTNAHRMAILDRLEAPSVPLS